MVYLAWTLWPVLRPETMVSPDLPVRVGRSLSLVDLEDVAVRKRKVVFDDEARVRVERSRAAIDAIALEGDAAPRVYGGNTRLPGP